MSLEVDQAKYQTNRYFIQNPKYFEQLIFITSKDHIRGLPVSLQHSYKHLALWINSLLPQLDGYKMSTKIHWIFNDMVEFPRCLTCNQEIKKDVSINKQYNKYCSIDCAGKSEIRKQHQIATCLDRYGVTNGGGSREAQLKIRKKYFYDGYYFDSSPEIAFYIWLVDNNIKFEYHPNEFIHYVFNGKQKIYQPDFKVDGQLIELKGGQFLNQDGTWQCPYDKTKNSEFEFKHQVIMNHQVKIMYFDDYKQYLRYVESKYGVNYLTQFRCQSSKRKQIIHKCQPITITNNNLEYNQYYKNNQKLYLELKSLIEQNPRSYVAKLNGIMNQNGRQKNLQYYHLTKWINSSLPILSDPVYKMSTKCYWIIYGLTNFPVCQLCHSSENYKNKNIRSFQDGYKDFCSVSCGTKYANLYIKVK